MKSRGVPPVIALLLGLLMLHRFCFRRWCTFFLRGDWNSTLCLAIWFRPSRYASSSLSSSSPRLAKLSLPSKVENESFRWSEQSSTDAMTLRCVFELCTESRDMKLSSIPPFFLLFLLFCCMARKEARNAGGRAGSEIGPDAMISFDMIVLTRLGCSVLWRGCNLYLFIYVLSS